MHTRPPAEGRSKKRRLIDADDESSSDESSYDSDDDDSDDESGYEDNNLLPPLLVGTDVFNEEPPPLEPVSDDDSDDDDDTFDYESELQAARKKAKHVRGGKRRSCRKESDAQWDSKETKPLWHQVVGGPFTKDDMFCVDLRRLQQRNKCSDATIKDILKTFGKYLGVVDTPKGNLNHSV